MTNQEATEYCMNKKGAWIDFPFNDETILIKVLNHYFCTVFTRNGMEYITVKGNADTNENFRLLYPSEIQRGYHCPPIQQPYNNTIATNMMDATAIKHMIDLSYDYTVGKFTRKERVQYENL